MILSSKHLDLFVHQPFTMFSLHLLSLLLLPALVASAPSQATQQACKELSKALPNRVSFPLSINYHSVSSEYWSTVLHDIKPACVVIAESALDVSSAVKILKNYPAVKFTAKSGGHDPNAGHATVADGVLISLTEMKGATYNRSKNLAYVRPGGEWNDVISALQKEGVTVVGGRLG